MTKKDFFVLLIKVFGLYSLILSVFTYFPWNFNTMFFDLDLWTLLQVLGFIGVVLGVYVLLVRNADRVVNWLKLDHGFDDDRIEIGNFNATGMVSFAIILIGGFLIVDYFPSLLDDCYLAFKQNV
ncbi:MAG: hypothetical protein ACI86C_001994 [Candidatus Latescibacterota bacterium]|jgi:hypothetical protein